MMHGDSRVMVVVCLETASLPAPCLSTSTSPRSREEPQKRRRSAFWKQVVGSAFQPGQTGFQPLQLPLEVLDLFFERRQSVCRR